MEIETITFADGTKIIISDPVTYLSELKKEFGIKKLMFGSKGNRYPYLFARGFARSDEREAHIRIDARNDALLLIHELGHIYGLKHSDVWSHVMQPMGHKRGTRGVYEITKRIAKTCGECPFLFNYMDQTIIWVGDEEC